MSRRLPTRPPNRRGFSFVELLFAMAVLSVGLIGVAAALYAGLDQSKLTYDDTAAAGVARQAVAVLGQVMDRKNVENSGAYFRRCYDAVTPAEPGQTPVQLRDAMAGSQISAADPRYAWTAVYRRRDDTPAADVVVVVLRAEARSAFDDKDLINYDTPALPQTADRPPTLVPTLPLDVRIEDNELFFSDPSNDARADAGAIFVLTDTADATLNGRPLRLAGRGDRGGWRLAPGYDLPAVGGAVTAKGVLVGRGYKDVTRPADGYAGGNQAIAAYAAIVALR